jgi:hypothetical protein
MKLLLQRTLNSSPSGPSWVESAHLADGKLGGFLEIARDLYSHYELRFAPNREPFWISDREASLRFSVKAKPSRLLWVSLTNLHSLPMAGGSRSSPSLPIS